MEGTQEDCSQQGVLAELEQTKDAVRQLDLDPPPSERGSPHRRREPRALGSRRSVAHKNLDIDNCVSLPHSGRLLGAVMEGTQEDCSQQGVLAELDQIKDAVRQLEAHLTGEQQGGGGEAGGVQRVRALASTICASTDRAMRMITSQSSRGDTVPAAGQPGSMPSSGGDGSAVSDRGGGGNANAPGQSKHKGKTRSKLSTQVRVTTQGLDDGFIWRKYGQKEILGAKHPRAYYRCAHRHDQGCHATRQVQRTDDDPLLYDVVYYGVHTCSHGARASAVVQPNNQSMLPAAAMVEHTQAQLLPATEQMATSGSEAGSVLTSEVSGSMVSRKRDSGGEARLSKTMQSDLEYQKNSECHSPERLDSSDLRIQLPAAKRFLLGPKATIDSPSLNSVPRNRVNSVTDTISAYDSRFESSLNLDGQTKTALTFQSTSQDSEITELFDHGHFDFYSREDTPFALGQTNKFTESMQIEEPHSDPYKDVMAWFAMGRQKGRLSHTCMQKAGQELLLGRDDIRLKVMEKILLDRNGVNNCTVICIYGCSGLGKTSLLHVLYKDQQLLDGFDKRIWIQMSEKVDLVMFFRKIIGFGMNEHCSIKNIDILRELVVEEITDKKFLLFLDDADNENQQFWTTVLEVLNTGAKGSVVVMATRSSTIAADRNVATYSYSLNPLSEENKLMIFQQYSGVGTDIQNIPDLVMVAKRFISSFGSNPLNLKATGGLLCHADTTSLEKDIFEGSVMPLRLCHDALPVHLKRCLALCLLFPEGYIFDKHHMVLLWISHGCVRPVEGYELEDVGVEYFNELLCRSFFQCSPIHSDKDDMFVMHELIYNVVASVSRVRYFKSEDPMCSIPENVLHCSIISSQFQTVELMHRTEQLKDLQTFLALQPKWKPNRVSLPSLNLAGLDDFFLKFTSLEILDLSHTETKELPVSIAGLRNLRYLSVNSTNIRVLPSELGSLSNLQTLEAKHCHFLTELPRDIKTLVQLCHLDLTKELGYVHLPHGIGELTELQTLPVFHVSEDSSHCCISELGSLHNLRGCLWLSGLESVKPGSKAQDANLKDKHHLKDLTLQWHDDENQDEYTEDVADHEQVLGGLQPHANLQVLAIRGYEGSRFPAWIQFCPSLPNLVTLTLDNCCNCTEFPAIAHLPSLKFLSVRKMYDVQRLSSNTDTHGQGTAKFPSLELLNLWEMYGLEELFSNRG